MLFHIAGAVSSFAFLLTWYGLGKQISEIRHREQCGQKSTLGLSINQFVSSYFAFFANFIFAIAVDVFNHYLFWTRLGALALLLIILFKIWQERRTAVSGLVYYFSFFIFIAGLLSIAFRPYPGIAKMGANTLMMIVTLLLIQGTVHQILTIRKAGTNGALSPSLFRSILIKDLSTLGFAFTMPFATAWPLLVLNGASVIFRGALLLQIEKLSKKQRI
ncbi:hypothetical protein [Alteromonas sp. C1M14]|uniref:hypothetical protein n=1 Tax=Alteromonas sp. C1M14 TaxID=2841567 RepID=UPI001C08DDC4|nr:hypothetical protein [Alteromonas sp. C1M14]MBU2978233.1 hypothetical protein [Alteromonas sp. C1M14]